MTRNNRPARAVSVKRLLIRESLLEEGPNGLSLGQQLDEMLTTHREHGEHVSKVVLDWSPKPEVRPEDAFES